MAFNVTLYSFTKEVNSTARPSGSGSTYPCVVITPCDIINPQLRLQLGTGYNPSTYNYCYVPAWGRYYWINDWIMDGPIWTAVCNVDPLASWKTQIGATSAYVLRAAADYDGDLVDVMYPMEANPTVTDTAITKWWSDSDLDYTEGRFIVGTISVNGATSYSALTPSEFSHFAAKAFSDDVFNLVNDKPWLTKAIFDPMQYLASVTWFPFDLQGAGGRTQDVYLGYWFSQVRGLQIATTHEYTRTVTLPKHPQRATRGAYLDRAPYSNYLLDIRPFGRIALPTDLLAASNSITLSCIVDWISGNAVLRITNSSGVPVAMQESHLGVTVQVSQVLRDYFGGALGAVGSVIGAGVALGTGNITGAITGAASAIGSAANMMEPSVTTSGMNSGFSRLYGSRHLTSAFHPSAAEDLAHRGRPLCAVRRLDTLPGYQLCTDTDLQLPCTRTEMDAIRGYLESGYYFE